MKWSRIIYHAVCIEKNTIARNRSSVWSLLWLLSCTNCRKPHINLPILCLSRENCTLCYFTALVYMHSYMKLRPFHTPTDLLGELSTCYLGPMSQWNFFWPNQKLHIDPPNLPMFYLFLTEMEVFKISIPINSFSHCLMRFLKSFQMKSWKIWCFNENFSLCHQSHENMRN